MSPIAHSSSPVDFDVTRIGADFLHDLRYTPIQEGIEAVCLDCSSVSLIPRDSDIDPVLGCAHNQRIAEAIRVAWGAGHEAGHARGVSAGIDAAVSQVRNNTSPVSA